MAALTLSRAASFVLCLVPLGTAAGERPPDLVPGDGPERALAPGESHAYALELKEGEFVYAIAEQRGIDVALLWRGPVGAPVESDLAEGTQGRESLPFVAAASGAHGLEVRAVRAAGPSGRYRLSVTAARPPTAGDRDRLAAEAAFAEGERARRAQAKDSLKAALPALARAQTLYERLPDERGVAAALTGRAAVHMALGEHDAALALFADALARWRARGDRYQEGAVLDQIGEVLFYKGDLPQALVRLSEALEARRAAGDTVGEGRTLDNLGVVAARSGDLDRALALRGESLAIWRSLGRREDEAASLGNLSVTLAEMGDLQGALDQLRAVLPIRRDAGDRPGEAATLSNLGVVYLRLGDLPRALEHHARALPIWRALGDRRGEATVLNSIGYLHGEGGRLDQAADLLGQALEIRRHIGDRRGEAHTLVNLGHVFQRQGDPARAGEHFQQGLERARQVGDVWGQTGTLMSLAHLRTDQGDPASARAFAAEGLGLAAKIQSRPGEAVGHSELARAARAAGDLREAQREVEAALGILESMRGQVRGADLRASFSSSFREIYELYVDVLMRLHERDPEGGFAVQALLAAERARARSLLELLAESRHAVREGVDPALRDQEAAGLRRLHSRLERRVRLLSGRHPPEQADALDREIEALRVEHERVERRIRTESPRYASLTQPDPPSLAAIQGALDPDTRLLELFLAEPRSYLWVVGPGTMRGQVLPGRGEIEAVARRLYDEWSRRPAGPVRPSEAAAALSRLLLDPIAAELGSSRLVVVTDGAVQYLPFAALPDPRTGRPLVFDREVIGAPSAATLAVLRAEAPGRARAPRLVAVFADPVFDREDARVRRKGASPSPRRGMTRGGQEAGFPETPARLPFTRREAQAILSLSPPGASWAAFDFEASRAAATSPRLRDYRFVHFATHGFLDSTHPERSGLVLSLVDEQGAPRDGFLTAGEVFNLELGADLVVLSGCRTGLGRDVKGEGLVGLTRGFMYAGAPRVLASLWRVDDAATAELMERVYRGLLGREPRSPAAALRAAQIALARDPRWRSPHYWAAFQLQGAWN